MLIKGWKRAKRFKREIDIDFEDLAYSTRITNGYLSEIDSIPLKSDKYGLYHIIYRA